MKLIHLFLTIAGCLVLSNCEKAKQAGDTSFARSTFASLVRGDSEVQTKIDWPILYANGVNAGAAYTALESDTQKQDFRTAFVTNFSSTFRQGGGSVDDFTNWRVTFHDTTRTEVAADSTARGVLKLTVSERDSQKRISSIDIVK